MDVINTKITIPRVPVGLNSTNRGGRREPGLLRMHWRARHRYNEHWRHEIMAALGGPREPEPKGYHVFIALYRQRLLDTDNAYASVKPCVDALVRCGALYSDSPKWLTLEVKQVLAQDEHTDIVISEEAPTDAKCGYPRSLRS